VRDRGGANSVDEWTFPSAFAEVISGTGSRVHRQRVDLGENEAFSKKGFVSRWI
jgi:hypothetical protein